MSSWSKEGGKGDLLSWLQKKASTSTAEGGSGSSSMQQTLLAPFPADQQQQPTGRGAIEWFNAQKAKQDQRPSGGESNNNNNNHNSSATALSQPQFLKEGKPMEVLTMKPVGGVGQQQQQRPHQHHDPNNNSAMVHAQPHHPQQPMGLFQQSALLNVGSQPPRSSSSNNNTQYAGGDPNKLFNKNRRGGQRGQRGGPEKRSYDEAQTGGGSGEPSALPYHRGGGGGGRRGGGGGWTHNQQRSSNPTGSSSSIAAVLQSQQQEAAVAAFNALDPAQQQQAVQLAERQQQLRTSLMSSYQNQPHHKPHQLGLNPNMTSSAGAHGDTRSTPLLPLPPTVGGSTFAPASPATERLDIGLLLELIGQHQVTIICTDTGSGKSTLVPKALLELSSNTKIVTTQPRRTATVNIASHVAKLRGESVGEDVGYWIRGDKKGDDRTRLWYMTSYTLFLFLLNNPLNPPFTHIILDEFHERSPDVEITVALLKLCLKQKTSNFKLILMSATMNTEDWESHFEGLTTAVYKQSEPQHPIHDFFMEDICDLLGCPYQVPAGFSPTVVDHTQFELHIFLAQQLIGFLNALSVPEHSILVFLPGRAQVEHFQYWAQTNLAHRMDIIPWHSAVELGAIQSAIQRPAQGRQKLYIATDIAEVSITLPDVVFVIDLALVKRPQMLQGNPASILYPPLLLQWISKSSVAQRRGRIGRVQQGFYFCLLSKQFVPMLPRYTSPPIENTRIDELALHSLQLVAHPAAIFSICRGQPLFDSIKHSMDTLTHLGCIIKSTDPRSAAERIEEIFSNSKWNPLIMNEAKAAIGEAASIDEYVCTFVGRLLQLIPIASQPGMLVFYGLLTGLESLMILAAAVTNSISPFSIHATEMEILHDSGGGGRRKPKMSSASIAKAMEQTEEKMKEYTKGGLRSDIVAIVSAILTFLEEQGRAIKEIASKGPMPPGAVEERVEHHMRQWAKDNKMVYERIIAIVELDAHIKYELSGFVPFRDVMDPTVLAAQLEAVAPIVLILTSVAFAAQALEVANDFAAKGMLKEGAIGLFTELRAVPDLHSPSSIRWDEGDIVTPVCISLQYTRMCVSFSNAIKNHKQFWLALLLFAHRVQYATYTDDEGVYSVFRVTYCGKSRNLEVDHTTAAKILQFRALCSQVCGMLRLRYGSKDLSEEEFNENVLQDAAWKGVFPKSIGDAQREVMRWLSCSFYGPGGIEQVEIQDVEHTEDDLDQESILSFALPAQQRNSQQASSESKTGA